MEYTLINKEFTGSIQTLRRILPKLAFGLLIGTYLVSALIMGVFHAQNSPNITFKIAAFLVPLAIQIGRGALVFFFQLNPIHLEGRFSFGTVSATALLFLSLWESYAVMHPYGESWTISVATLMLIGWIVEIMLLREINFATKWELYQNQPLWEDLQKFKQSQQKNKPTTTKIVESKLVEPITIPTIEQDNSETELEEITTEETTIKVEEAQEPKEVELFYGIPLDPNYPYFELHLKRLENRFRKRYEESLAKDEKRKAQGKASHKTTLKSIAGNLERLEQVNAVRKRFSLAA